MPLKVETPQELGADRLCNAVAAYAEFGGPCVVVDFGTATTWEVVSGKGEFLGGVIAPGLEIAAEALFSRAAKLPRVELVPPPRVIGKATIDSIQAGLMYGYVGLVEGVTKRVVDEVGGGKVIATGGLATVIARHTSLFDAVDDDLTLKGLHLLWERNRPDR
jgi:type III pantothenate kinase